MIRFILRALYFIMIAVAVSLAYLEFRDGYYVTAIIVSVAAVILIVVGANIWYNDVKKRRQAASGLFTPTTAMTAEQKAAEVERLAKKITTVGNFFWRTVYFVGIAGLAYLIYSLINNNNIGSDDTTFFITLIAIGSFFWIGVGAGVWHHTVKMNKQEATPLLTAPVTVISKLHEQKVSGSRNWTTTEQFYFISFEFPDRGRKKFRVEAAQYAVILEGETGILHYKEVAGLVESKLVFIDFKPQLNN